MYCPLAYNNTFREECLDQHWFVSIEEARTTIEAWRQEYNLERPHSALGNVAPAVFAATGNRTRSSSGATLRVGAGLARDVLRDAAG